MKSRILFLVALSLSFLVSAQETARSIDLETCLQLGGANNLTIQEYKQKQELALADLASAKEWWLPEVYAGIQLHQLWGKAMNGNGLFFEEVDRQNFWGGLGFNASWDFGKGIYTKKAAKLKATAAQYDSQTAQNKAILNILETYYDFMVSQLYADAYSELVSQSDTIAAQMQVQVDAGMRYESEALLAHSNTSHLKIEQLNARMELITQSAKLIELLNLNPSMKLVASDSVLVPLRLTDVTAVTTLDFSSVYEYRPELISAELSLQSLTTEKKSFTTGLLLPELRLGSYGSYFGDVVYNLDPTSQINGSLMWRIPLGQLIYKGDQKRFDSKIALQRTSILQTKAHINAEIICLREQINIAQMQINIAKEASKLSLEALSQCIQRQALGLVNPLEIMQAQEIFIESKLDHLQAVAEFNKASYGLLVAMGGNL